MLAAAEAGYENAKTSVWWDMDSCPIPDDCYPHEITNKIISALKQLNYIGDLSICAYGYSEDIPSWVEKALSSTGIYVNHVHPGMTTLRMVTSMLEWARDNPTPANIMLISDDDGFSEPLHQLQSMGYNILVAHPPGASKSILDLAKTTWLWESLLGETDHTSH